MSASAGKGKKIMRFACEAGLTINRFLQNDFIEKSGKFAGMESLRQQKVNKLLAKELAEIFRSEARNLFAGGFISVTGVRVSPDLSSAKVYVSIMGSKDRDAIFKLIENQNHVIRRKLGSIIGKQLRIVPELTFFIDDSLDYAMKIEELLKK